METFTPYQITEHNWTLASGRLVVSMRIRFLSGIELRAVMTRLDAKGVLLAFEPASVPSGSQFSTDWATVSCINYMHAHRAEFIDVVLTALEDEAHAL